MILGQILFSNEQFFMLIMLVIWIITIVLSEEQEDIALNWIQFIISMPLGLFEC